MPQFDPGPEAIDDRALAQGREASVDRALVAAVQEGDLETFRTLHEQYVVDLLDFAYTYLHSRDDAEETVQELFLWIWEHRYEWSPRGGVRPYLFKAVRNRAINRLRQRRVQARFAERVASRADLKGGESAVVRDPLANVTADELGGLIARAIEALPPRTREVFLLVRERRLSYANVAELLGISPKTVENHMNSALGRLRSLVAEWRAS